MGSLSRKMRLGGRRRVARKPSDAPTLHFQARPITSQAVDVAKAARLTAPQIARTPTGRRLQQLWWEHPNHLDYEGIDTPLAAKEPAMERPAVEAAVRIPAKPTLNAKITFATGANPNRPYQFEYQVIDLDDLITSHTVRLEPDERYPKGLQPRVRDRAASRLQIDLIAKNLSPEELTEDRHTLDRGPMIVGPDKAVESGNGRVIALRRAEEVNPTGLRDYFAHVKAEADRLGLRVEGITKPVLVRKRLSDVDRIEFAAEANQATVLQMSPAEQAIQDSKALSDQNIASLVIADSQSIDGALKATANRILVREFLAGLPSNERAGLVDANGQLNQTGMSRLKSALFANVYPGDAGIRLTNAFTESLDPNVKQVENAMFDSLPSMAKAESLTRSGERESQLSIANDVSKAVDILSRLKQAKVTGTDYIAQKSMFKRELTPVQERLLLFFEEFGRSRKAMREFLIGYATAVQAAPNPKQGAFFSDVRETKDEIIARQIKANDAPVGLFAFRETALATT